MLSAERRVAPALVLLLCAAFVPLATASEWTWVWFGAALSSLVLRWIVARIADAPADRGGAANLVAALYGVDLLLWSVLLLALPAAQTINAAPGLVAAGVVLLAALSLRHAPAAWALFIGGWALLAVIASLRASPPIPTFLVAFLPWLAAVWWAGRRTEAEAASVIADDAPARIDPLTALVDPVTESTLEAPTGSLDIDHAGPAALPAPPRPRGDRARELLLRLPGLVWNVDMEGRLIELRGDAAWRWGMWGDVETHPHWAEAFKFDAESQSEVERAIARAVAGQPTFDVLNRRTTRSGARIALRSHFVPFSGPAVSFSSDSNASVLVLDTIAAPHELLEVERLRKSRAEYKGLVDASASLIWACDAQFRITFASRRAAREIYRCEPHHLVGRPLSKLLADGVEQHNALRALAGLRLGETMRDVEMVHGAFDGARVPVAVTASAHRGADGSFHGAVGTVTDLTVIKHREQRLTEALQVERTVLDSAGEAIAVVKAGKVLRCNEAFLRLLRTDPAHLSGVALAEFFERAEDWDEIVVAAQNAHGDDRAAVRELQVRRAVDLPGGASESMWCQVTARLVAPDECVIVLVDIDRIRRRETDALHVAHHDELTGLPNRRLLATRAQPALAAAAAGRGLCAVMALDLDGFKAINDRFGHRMGDAVLREIAQRMLRVVRPNDTVARRGGDEFAILLPNVGTRLDAERIASRLLHAIAQPLVLTGGHEGWVSASIGVALSPQQGRDLERLLQVADAAMYHAKLQGKNRYELPSDFSAEAPRAAQVH